MTLLGGDLSPPTGVMAGVLPPRAPADATTVIATTVTATVVLRSPRTITSLHQVDVPHLSLHEYHRRQNSPLVSPSPELDFKKVRRKPSIADLSTSPVKGDIRFAPSSNTPPSLYSFSQRDLPPRLHPHPPTTPITRAYPASPSLSSTVTTLQSTPTHTPIFRGDAQFVQRRTDERTALEEPLRTKRKFDSLKRAKRFPRQASSGSSDSRDGGLWEVYAGVFDIAGDQGGLSEESLRRVEDFRASHEKQRPADDFAATFPTTREARSVRFKEVEHEHRSSSRHTRASSRTPGLPEKDPTATSSFSLSKFEFPAPPGQDNWAHTSERFSKSPSAVLLYRGASFDLINPRASLLLQPHDIETPGEIDGLLNDYFDEDDEDQATANMSYNQRTGEPSQASPRIPSENSRLLRTLYDDAETARRNILGVEDEPTKPLPVLYGSSANHFEHSSPVPVEFREGKGKSPALQQQHLSLRRVGTNPFRRAPSLGGSMGVGSMVGEGPQSVPRFSDPFDLTVSDNGNIVELRSIDGVLGRERAAEAAETKALASEESDLAMGSLLNKYDYPRHQMPPSVSESPTMAEIEQGLGLGGCAGEEEFGFYTPVPASTPFRASYYGIWTDDSASFPTPPAPVYGGVRRISRSSELPTSEQTYGETNQLLMITPEMHRRAAQRMGPEGSSQVYGDSHTRNVKATTNNFRPAEPAPPRTVRSSSVYPATDNGSAWQTEADISGDDGDSYANTSADGDSIRISREEPDPAPPQQQLPRGFYTQQELIDEFNRDRVEKGDPSIRYDVREAMRIMEDKMMHEARGTHLLPDHVRRDREAQMLDQRKLEELRQKDCTIVQEACDRLWQRAHPEKTSSKSSFLKLFKKDGEQQHVYKRSSTFGRLPKFQRTPVQTADDHSFNGSFSSRRGLMSSPRPAMRSNLEFSESEGTFVTVRDIDSPFDDRQQHGWHPNDPHPTVRALGVPTPTSTAAARTLGLSTTPAGPITTTRIPLQFRSTTRVDRRPAIESQIELQELRLIKNVRANRSPGRALTNAELIDREPGWTEFPDLEHRTRRQPTLLPVDSAIQKKQQKISETVSAICALCPITSLAFGLGRMDWYIASRSSGQITEMSKNEKKQALFVYTPLSCLVYAILIVVIVLSVKLAGGHDGPDRGGPLPGTNF